MCAANSLIVDFNLFFLIVEILCHTKQTIRHPAYCVDTSHLFVHGQISTRDRTLIFIRFNLRYSYACSHADKIQPRINPHRIVIVISRFLKRYLKVTRTRAPAYSRALRRIKGRFPKRGQEKLRSDFQNTRRRQSSC